MSGKNQLSALLIGPTDKTKIFRFGKIKEDEYETLKQEFGRVLAKHIHRVIIIPDEGIPLDIAKSYKENGGLRVIGYLPKGGCEELKRYFNYCDSLEEIDGGWSTLNTCLSLKGDVMIGFGLSPGTLTEIAYSAYHFRYLKRRIPILLYEKAISSRLQPELEEEVDIRYFNTPSELDVILEKIGLVGK
ncbi:hypothetical protein FJZ19_02395 [Candidatus Pacearchaeota archaeon]|nr:hypothetical protein [Candidatus Pacearchaeota archaeon]